MDINTTFKYWLTVAKHSGFKIDDGFTRPDFVGSHAVPEDLTALTIGDLIELGDLSDRDESLYRICEIVLGITDKTEIEQARAVDVVRFIGWVTSEVKRINKLFASTSTKPTPQEVAAGIKSLHFGLFGLLDWYAKRMGINDHDEVLGVKWLRIFKCLDMDNKKNQFNRKLQEVYSNEYKRKNKGNLHR